MTLELQLIKFAEFCVFASVVYYVSRQLLVEMRMRSFRDKLFRLRHRLFIYAADGNCNFDEPAYRALRRHINHLIVGADWFSPVRLALFLAIRSRLTVGLHGLNDVEGCIRNVEDQKLREALEEFHAESMRLAISFITFGVLSPSVQKKVAAAQKSQKRSLHHTDWQVRAADGIAAYGAFESSTRNRDEQLVAA